MQNNLHPRHKNNTLSTRIFNRSFFRKLIHAFNFFDIDYHFLAGHSFPPKSVCFILTEKCNLKCRMCDIGRMNSQQTTLPSSPLVKSICSGDEDMHIDDWLRVVAEMSQLKPKPLILLTGTEPFLYPDIITLTNAIAAAGLALHITTNGTLLGHYAQHLADLCNSGGLLDITVSLDDIEDYHDIIRGVQGTFQKAVAGIEALISRREAMNQPFPTINITCTISSYNHDHLESFVEWFVRKKFHLQSITFNHLWFRNAAIAESHNRKYGKDLPAEEENMEGVDISAIDMLRVARQIHHIKTTYAGTPLRIYQHPDLSFAAAQQYYSCPTRFVFYDTCKAPWRNVSVTPRGNIILSPLCFLPSVGNIKKKSFAAIWNGEQFTKMRRDLKKIKAYPACSRCCLLFDSKTKYYKIASMIR